MILFLAWFPNILFIAFLGLAAASKKNVNMKVVDDKLKIIDDVPNSAVEMAVKEKVSEEDA